MLQSARDVADATGISVTKARQVLRDLASKFDMDKNPGRDGAYFLKQLPAEWFLQVTEYDGIDVVAMDAADIFALVADHYWEALLDITDWLGVLTATPADEPVCRVDMTENADWASGYIHQKMSEAAVTAMTEIRAGKVSP